MTDAPAFSYRDDPVVPSFADDGPIVLMDGECALCSGAARIIARLDRKNEFRICPVQTELGRALLAHYQISADDPETWLYLEEGRAYQSMEAVTRAARRLGGWARLLSPLALLPRPVADWLYRRIARNRLRVFGRADLCAMPDAAVRARLLQ